VNCIIQGGHINPISYFYLSHSLLDADYKDIELTIDKKQSTSLVLMTLFYPLIFLASFLLKKKKEGNIKQ